jgi:hypothetical protein
MIALGKSGAVHCGEKIRHEEGEAHADSLQSVMAENEGTAISLRGLP